MNTEKRAQEIKNNIKSCSKDGYLKSEILPEMLKLQREVVELTFNKEHADLGNLKLWDVENHLSKLSEENDNAALPELFQFKESCKEVSNLIKAEISGNWGEEKTFSCIDKIREPHILLKNIALNRNGVRTEIDGVVLTRKGAFIVEVKNTKKNIFIDENGDYYRVGDYSRWDSNIGEKLQLRKNMLCDVLKDAGFSNINIYPIVVFTNNRIEVKNRNNEIATCFIPQLPYSIAEQEGCDSFNTETLSKIADIIDEARYDEPFALDFDADQFKQNFAILMAKLEEAANNKAQENEEECPETNNVSNDNKVYWRSVLEGIFSQKSLQVAGAVAAVTVAVVTTVINLRNRY